MPRTAVVTGGAGGIGGAIVRALVADGWRLVVLDREEANLDARGDAVADGETRASEPVEFVGVDLADTDSLAAVGERIGPCDAFVHAAAAFDRFDLAGFDLPTWRRVHAVNVEAPLLLARALTRGMADARFGRIVLVTSNTVLRPPVPDLLPYIA